MANSNIPKGRKSHLEAVPPQAPAEKPAVNSLSESANAEDYWDNEWRGTLGSGAEYHLAAVSRALEGLEGVDRIVRADECLRTLNEEGAADDYTPIGGYVMGCLSSARDALRRVAQDELDKAREYFEKFPHARIEP